jgi:hypothetical protein
MVLLMLGAPSDERSDLSFVIVLVRLLSITFHIYKFISIENELAMSVDWFIYPPQGFGSLRDISRTTIHLIDLGRGNASSIVRPPTVRMCRNIRHGETMCRELRKFEKHCSRATLKSNGGKASPCFRAFWIGNVPDKFLPIRTLL